MKKVLMILLSAILVLSMAGVVSAVDATTQSFTQVDLNGGLSGSKTANVTLTLKELFTVTLPAEFILEPASDGLSYYTKGSLKVDIIRLDQGHTLSISVDSVNYDSNSNFWNLVLMRESVNGVLEKVEGGAKLPYSMGFGSENSHVGDDGNTPINKANGDAYIISETNVDVMDKFIHVKMATPSSGTINSAVYQDQLTFTVTVNED